MTPTPDLEFQATVRVALLTHYLGPHSLPLCEWISKAVPQFHVFTSAEADEFHGFPREWGAVKVTVQKSFNHLRVLRRAYGYWQTGELHIPYDTYGHLQAFAPDIILSNQLGIRTTLAALYRKRHAGVKLILWATLSRHSESRRAWPRRVLRKWLIRQIDGAFVNGSSGEEYLRHLGYRGPVFTIPYTIDGAAFETHLYAPQEFVIRLLYAGRLIPQKGLTPFCAALSKWCADHPSIQVRFRLIGDGPEAAKLHKIALPANLSFEFLPKMSRSDLARYYQEADIFAFPTLGDEWGVVVNEAMIAGRPVMGSVHSQSTTELVTEGKTGWLFDPNEPATIYNAMTRAFTRSVEELCLMSANAQQAVQHLSPQKVAENALRAMRSIC